MIDAENSKKYYVGLDVGTNSVGYAVTDENYNLKKFKGEAMWGVTVFDEAQTAAERRAHRTERRRLDRRQHRVELIRELFAREICQKDPKFFVRLQESALVREPGDDYVQLFPTKAEQKEYYKKYPTIHHLIAELTDKPEYHDVRLVYMACAWLVAHRGHFLSDVNKENVDNVLEFGSVYDELTGFLNKQGFEIPWDKNDDKTIGEELKKRESVSVKFENLKKNLFETKIPKIDEKHPYDTESLLKLICGGSLSLKKLYGKEEYDEIKVCLGMEEDALGEIYSQIADEEDIELLKKLKAVYDWSVLTDVLDNQKSISHAKISVYKQHKEDLKFLKRLLKDDGESYSKVFKTFYTTADGGKHVADEHNYVLYSMHINKKEREILSGKYKSKIEKAGKADFSKYLLSIVEKITPKDADKEQYDDMIARLKLCCFLPKQKDSDNRVIPYQLYWSELDKILKNAEGYLPFLKETDEDGITVSDKIRSVFEFRVPYYVGPCKCKEENKNAWMERKAEGKIYPWNFEDKVDLDKCENEFIRRLTNTCTYLPGEKVLPANSLCYSAYKVLNEINNIKINEEGISVEQKQGIYNDLFMKIPKVTFKKIKDYLISRGIMSKDDNISGIDENVKSSLKPWIQFGNLIENKSLELRDVEKIIERATFSEDKRRFAKWLKEQYPRLSDNVLKDVSSLKFEGFGRLSKKLLCEVGGVDKESGTGELKNIMRTLWETNCNLMQVVLSDRFTFREEIDGKTKDYYSNPENRMTLDERLANMYISGAVRRPIIRTLDIMNDIVKINGQPDKIFVEMARDFGNEKKGTRTKSRYEQLKELYKKIENDENYGSIVRELENRLADMGDQVDNRLQSNKLFLYFTQLGKCMYSGEPIMLKSLCDGDGKYNIEHIYPRSKVKDDSVLNNEVLVNSELNGQKKDTYPINPEIRRKREEYWKYLYEKKLITENKYKRLIRKTHFSDDEKSKFINRQIVDTRQATKALTVLLKEKYPESEIVYVKAGLVAEFRNEFDMNKSRIVNDMHHAKDAYLNIVAGNVYSIQSRQWVERIKKKENYSLKTETLFKSIVKYKNEVIWNGTESISKIQKIIGRTPSRFTKYQFCRKGALFDVMPLSAAEGLMPRKKDLPVEIYGGYNKTTTTYFVPVRYKTEKKRDIIIMPVDLMYGDRFLKDDSFAAEYARRTIEGILNKEVHDIEFLFNKRILKVNTMLSLDGFYACISGKSNEGRRILLTGMTVFTCGQERETYVKKLESFAEKQKTNKNIHVNRDHDKITEDKNIALYDYYIEKFSKWPYCKRPNNPIETLRKGGEGFKELDDVKQIKVLLGVQSLFGRGIKADLTDVGGSVSTGVMALSTSLSNWKNKYTDVRIIDMSASGLFKTKSENLLDML